VPSPVSFPRKRESTLDRQRDAALDPRFRGGDTLERARKRYVLPDVLVPNLITVFCGSAVGRKSALLRASYAGPGNKFWPTLHAVGITPRLIVPSEYRTMTEFGIGLTDMNKHEFGGDHELTADADNPRALRRKILKYQPRILAFTAKRPAQVFLDRPVAYGLQPDTIGATRLFVLPSPSGRAGAFWDISHWRALAELHRSLA
jgi:double-stranded uracil-DNA glycosylase